MDIRYKVKLASLVRSEDKPAGRQACRQDWRPHPEGPLSEIEGIVVKSKKVAWRMVVTVTLLQR